MAEIVHLADRTPQVWTLYKEVQRYWDRGLRVPDDVTVVLTAKSTAEAIRAGVSFKDVPREPIPELGYHVSLSALAAVGGMWISIGCGADTPYVDNVVSCVPTVKPPLPLGAETLVGL